MPLFQIVILFAVAELSCLRHPVVYGEGSLETSSEKADEPAHRAKRWLWGGKVNSLAFKLLGITTDFSSFILRLCTR